MMDMKSVFERVVDGFDKYMGTSELRSFHCPIKTISNLKMIDGVSVERQSKLIGNLNDGLSGYKEIYVNDLTGEYRERVTLDDGTVLENQGITTYRCGLMTCLAISKFNIDFDSVGFIGSGRTNLMNCRAITEIFGRKEVIIRGSERDRGKNKIGFMSACSNYVYVDDSEDLELINQCDIVVVCTSSYKKEDMISVAQLNNPKLIIALDSGYLLDESFRTEYDSFTDYVEQMNAYYDEEFPYDEKRYDFIQLSDDCRSHQGQAVVYLHGIGLADIIVANEMIKARS